MSKFLFMPNSCAELPNVQHQQHGIPSISISSAADPSHYNRCSMVSRASSRPSLRPMSSTSPPVSLDGVFLDEDHNKNHQFHYQQIFQKQAQNSRKNSLTQKGNQGSPIYSQRRGAMQFLRIKRGNSRTTHMQRIKSKDGTERIFSCF